VRGSALPGGDGGVKRRPVDRRCVRSLCQPDDRRPQGGYRVGAEDRVEPMFYSQILSLRSQFYFLAHETLATMGRKQPLSRAYVCTVLSNAHLANI
jgi:hypothetical protein